MKAINAALQLFGQQLGMWQRPYTPPNLAADINPLSHVKNNCSPTWSGDRLCGRRRGNAARGRIAQWRRKHGRGLSGWGSRRQSRPATSGSATCMQKTVHCSVVEIS